MNTFRMKHLHSTLLENLRKYTPARLNSMASYTTESSKSAPLLPPRPPRTESLAGTVQFHSSYLFLHVSEDPENWPKVFTFPLFLQLKEKLGKHDGLVNVCWSKPPASQSSASILNFSETEASYGGTFWIKRKDQDPLHKGIFVPVITSETVSVLEEHLDRLLADNSNANFAPPPPPPPPLVAAAVESRIAEEEEVSTGPYFYICCHGHRDCRCGIRGGGLADALTNELASRNMLVDERGRPRLGRVGHVGGHKQAPNLIIFPQGDWYGNLEPTDLPDLVNRYTKSPQSNTPSLSLLLNGPNQCQWRGRMGMTKQEQLDAFQKSQSGTLTG